MTTCIYCGQSFAPSKPTTTICRSCWFGGRYFEEQRPALIAALRQIPGIASASFDHTGGGCWGLGVRLQDGRFLFAVVALKDSDTGEWYGDPSLPEPGEPWTVGVYADDDGGFSSGEPLTYDLPVTDDQLIERVRMEAAKEHV